MPALLHPSPPCIRDLAERFFADLSAIYQRPLSYEKFQRYLACRSTAAYLDDQIAEATGASDPALPVLQPWMIVMRALYELMPGVWDRMPAEERKIFREEYLIHFANYFGGFPLANALVLRRMLAKGQLEVVGAFTSVEKGYGTPTGFVFHAESGDYNVEVVFNASGLGGLAADQPLYGKLIGKKLLAPHPDGGVKVNPTTLQTLDHAGSVNDKLFALGEATKGTSLGVNAIARLVVQADTVAEFMIRQLLPAASTQS